MRILFLDDEEELVANLPKVLKDDGFEIEATADIHDAIERFSEHDYDAVLLDMGMPPTDDMDADSVGYGRRTGVEVARRMHGLKPHIPLALLTAIGDRKTHAAARKHGVVRVIPKPAEVEQIAEGLRAAIQSARGDGG